MAKILHLSNEVKLARNNVESNYSDKILQLTIYPNVTVYPGFNDMMLITRNNSAEAGICIVDSYAGVIYPYWIGAKDSTISFVLDSNGHIAFTSNKSWEFTVIVIPLS